MFKFHVGQIVCSRAAYEEWRLWSSLIRMDSISSFLIGEKKYPLPLIVNERIQQECSGGIQLQYGIRLNSHAQNTWILEHELMGWDEVTAEIRTHLEERNKKEGETK